MNLPYTMTPEMVADLPEQFKPDILYPYHFGNTDPQELVELLKDEEEDRGEDQGSTVVHQQFITGSTSLKRSVDKCLNVRFQYPIYLS